MSSSIRATKAPEQAGAQFTVHHYDCDPGADRVGLQAAAALGGKAAVLEHALVYLNGGQRGLQVRMNPREIVRVLGAVVVCVVACVVAGD